MVHGPSKHVALSCQIERTRKPAADLKANWDVMRVQVKKPIIPAQSARTDNSSSTSTSNIANYSKPVITSPAPLSNVSCMFPGQRHLLPGVHQSSESHLHLSVLFHLQKTCVGICECTSVTAARQRCGVNNPSQCYAR